MQNTYYTSYERHKNAVKQAKLNIMKKYWFLTTMAVICLIAPIMIMFYVENFTNDNIETAMPIIFIFGGIFVLYGLFFIGWLSVKHLRLHWENRKNEEITFFDDFLELKYKNGKKTVCYQLKYSEIRFYEYDSIENVFKICFDGIKKFEGVSEETMERVVHKGERHILYIPCYFNDGGKIWEFFEQLK